MKSEIRVTAVPEKTASNGISTKPFLREDSAISEVSLVTQEGGGPASADNRSFRYHESARSIVFRDTLRHQNHSSKTAPSGSPYSYRRGDSSFISYYSSDSNDDNNIDRVVDPLAKLPLTKHSPFLPLTTSQPLHQPLDSLNPQERHVVKLLQTQTAVVKTIKNLEWSTFLRKFLVESCFRTSTSLLPPNGQKMRCFGSTKEYTVGVVFALPTVGDSEEDAVYATLEEEQDEINRTQTWCWPSGYAAKTEFNVDKYGNLINGRKEALLPIQAMREYNHSYLQDTDYMIGGRLIQGGLSTVPYNEIMVRVGNRSSHLRDGQHQWKGSYEDGLGYPVALFIRAAHYGDLVSMIRIRARMLSVMGSIENCSFSTLPLLYLTPEYGVQVFTHEMQLELYQNIAQNVNPFRNATLYKTDMDNTSSEHLSQKIEELIDISQDAVRRSLTRKERMLIAGGFGATDESIFMLLMESLQDDTHSTKKKNKLVYSGVGEDLMSGLEGFGYDEPEFDCNNNEENNCYTHHGQELQCNVTAGLEASVRAGDYHTARQLLILYTLVASHGGASVRKLLPNLVTGQDDNNNGRTSEESSLLIFNRFLNFVSSSTTSGQSSGYSSDASERSSQSGSSHNSKASNTTMSSCYPRNPSVMQFHSVLDNIVNPKEAHDENGLLNPFANRPPPLDTSRLRAATNSSGLLVVLGAAHILKGIYDGSAKQRIIETIEAVDEWVENGENSVVFRLSSWNSQRTAQADLNIAIEHDTQFTSFIGKHAIDNRKKFTALLRNALSIPDSDDLSFLRTLHDMLSQMHRPCLRLELLQYILELDNRYSVVQLTRCVKLASTCLTVYIHDFSMFDKDVNSAI